MFICGSGLLIKQLHITKCDRTAYMSDQKLTVTESFILLRYKLKINTVYSLGYNNTVERRLSELDSTEHVD